MYVVFSYGMYIFSVTQHFRQGPKPRHDGRPSQDEGGITHFYNQNVNNDDSKEFLENSSLYLWGFFHYSVIFLEALCQLNA